MLDDFNRADENPVFQEAKWAASGIAGGTPLKLQGQQLVTSNSGTAYRVADFTGDLQAFFTVSALPGNLSAQLLYIALGELGTTAYDGYALALTVNGTGGQTLRLRRYDNGTITEFGSIGALVGVGNKLLIRKQGNTLEGWLFQGGAWTLRLTAQDATHASGKIGVQLFDAGFGAGGGAVDDFGGGFQVLPSGPSIGQSNGTFCDRGSLALTASCTLSDPVNTLTGAFVTQVEDLATPGTGISFAWTRSYTSADATVGPLGPGWTHSYAASLAVQPNGDVLARGEEGQEVYFTRQGDGSFVGAPGARASLTSISGGYELLRTDQLKYTFDAQGRLTSSKDRNNQGLTFSYDGQGRLATITDAAGRQASVAYNASNLVSSVSTQDGRNVGYAYTAGRLTSVTDVRGKLWTYTYDGGGRLEKIIDPLTHAQVTNVYGADGRVQSQTDAVGKTTTFAWDAATQLATVTDPNNKVWKDDYASNILTSRTDPLNNVTDFVHDADLNQTSVESPLNEATAMTYDAAGNLLTATAPASLGSAQKVFVYNGRNDVELVTDARGKVTDYVYNPTTGNLTSVTQDGVQIASYTYFPDGLVQTSTDGNEKTTTYTYTTNGYLASFTDPLGNKTTYTYDGAGRVLTRVDPKGNCQGCTPADFTWTYTYNPAGQLLTETDPLGHMTTNVYDDAGRLQSTTDANNHQTSYAYDDANRILSETSPDPDGTGPLTAPVTSYTYDNVGNKLTETSPDSDGGGPLSAPVTTFAYNGANELISTTGPDPDGGGPLAAPVTTQTYDANGNLASVVEPRGNVAGCNCATDYRTTYTYDAAGRQLTETKPDPDGAGPGLPPVTTNVYDPVGNLQSVRDGNNHTTSYTYDAAGRILTVTAPDGGVTTYTYDDAGNVLTRKDDNNHVTTSAYDDAGRLVSETGPDPDGGGPQTAPVTSYTYDPNGNRLTLTDPNGNATGQAGDGQTVYGYDRANRLLSINYSDATPNVTLTYDNVGNRLTMAEAGVGSETRTYDNLDRLLTATRGTNTFSYVYDAASNVTRRTYPGGTVSDYSYDPLNRLSSVVSGGQTTSYAYDVASNLTQTTLPAGNGYLETRAYDRVGRLTQVASAKGGATLAQFAATLDPVGNPTQVVRTGALAQTQTYTYDLNDRILSVCFQAGTCPNAGDPFIRWTYDKVGNRLSEQRPGAATVNYAYDARDRLLSAGSTSYSYDQNGNELTAGSRTFAYDLANRLKTTTLGSTTTAYTYDGDGVRLQASTGSQAAKKTNYLWDTNSGLPQIALERDGNSNPLRRYLYGVHRISQTAGNNTSYFIQDGLGSVANLTSSSGATQWTWSYEPFGSIRTETKASGNQPDNIMKFTGEYLDPTGLYHLRARQYDSTIGGFLRPDPIQPSPSVAIGSGYAYVMNRPTVLIDPAGLEGIPAMSSDEWRTVARRATSAVSTDGFTMGSCTYRARSPVIRIKVFGLPIQPRNPRLPPRLIPFPYRSGNGQGEISCSRLQRVDWKICTQIFNGFWVVKERCLAGEAYVRGGRTQELRGPELKTVVPCFLGSGNLFKSRIRDRAETRSDTSGGYCDMTESG